VPGTRIYLELGAKRTLAGAVEWPGWCRGGRNEHEAIAALAAYGDRYGAVVESTIRFKAPTDASAFQIVKRLKGNSGTDFGVPSIGLATDDERMDRAELERLTKLLRACWSAFDRAAHVAEAEQAYSVKLGARPPRTAGGRPVRSADLRDAMLAALRARARGLPVAEPSRAKTLWTPRYFTRRVAWHVLDHTWEIEDRAIRRT
jgi:hypothetical protein